MARGDGEDDPYRILGVPRDASIEQIKRAFRAKAKDSHPDKNPGDPLAQERFQKIRAAYELLGDKAKRAQYDRFGSAGQTSPEDFFAQFFRNFAQRDGELYNGATKKMKIKRAGKGGDAILEINVKPGWHSGTKVTFKGEGDDVGGVQQDICFVIKEAPHPRFVRVGPNLVTKVSIPLADALCGDVGLKIEMLDGSTLELNVREPVRPGQQIKVPGRGFPRSKPGMPPGDLLVECELQWPGALSEEQKTLLRQALSSAKL